MKFLVITSLLFGGLVAPSRRGDCSCKTPGKGETTYKGYESITVIERDHYKSMRGVVRDPGGGAMEDVLVEVFDKPEWMLGRQSSAPPTRHRIAACKTGAGGSFCFENIPAGEYELAFSKGIGWNDSHVYIKLKPGDPKAKTGIDMRMSLSN